MIETRALALPEIRKDRQFAQKAVAEKLGVNQAEVSKLERRPDMYVSTLKNYLEALGGQLEIYARFPDSEPIKITQFETERNEATTSGAASSSANSAERIAAASPDKPRILATFRTSTESESANVQHSAKSKDKYWIWTVCGSSPESMKQTTKPVSKKILQ
jgi:transcriptional regulator with XRE-family HTH domain